jgi:hypothetical protein
MEYTAGYQLITTMGYLPISDSSLRRLYVIGILKYAVCTTYMLILAV